VRNGQGREQQREGRREPALPEDLEAPETAALGELGELGELETVDGDLNGAPDLAGIEESAGWEAADAVDALEASDLPARDWRHSPAERLEQRVAERREVLLARRAEADEAGLGPLFEAVAAATGSEAGGAPLVADADSLRDRLAQLDSALGELEAALASPDGEARPRREDDSD
jgi:hypothetical protein